MKRAILLIVLVLVVGFAGTAYWYTSYNNKNLDNTRWLSRSFEGVQSIHVQAVQGTYMLTALKDGWEAQVPGASWNITARVLPAKVVEYSAKLSDLTPYRSIGGFDQGGPEEYGLDTPDLKVIVKFGGKAEPLTVKLTTDPSGMVFGWNSDSPGLVYEFGKKTLEQLSLPATRFLDTRVFQFDEEVVSKLQLVQPFGSSWLVEKRKEGFFFTLPGYLKEKPASDSELKLYIHALALLRATNLVLEPMVTDKRIPVLTLRLWTGSGEPSAVVEFFTVADNPDVYLGKSSWLTVPFMLDAESVGQLVRSAFDVQGRTVVKFDIGTVASFIVQYGGKKYVVNRSESGWRVEGGEKNVPGIDMSLWRFTELQFEALPLNNLPDSAIELMYCKLLDESGKKLTALTFYTDPKLPQGQCWMKNGGGMYYPVSSRLLKDLQGMFPANSIGTN
ncbi:MAG: DUF4340 domain-containing protein [Pseudodesulfovibrio sp.]|nr:DUF4340 domain-containing protein [Pseudodesulfovibrio sp.]